jgi:threonine/homoserine/homoserine lactone efflux protein
MPNQQETMLKICNVTSILLNTNKIVYFCKMLITLLIKGILIGLLVSVPLGPIGIIVIQRTISKSRIAGFLSGIGAALSDTLYAIIAGFSITFIIDFIRRYEFYFQIFGILIVLALGIHIFLKNPVNDIRTSRIRGNTHFQDVFSTFLLTFSNPLAVFVFLAFFTSSGVVVNLEKPFHSLLVIPGVFIGASIWWFSLSGLVSMFRHKINLRVLWWINKTAGALIILFVIITVIVAIQKGLTFA